MRVFMALPMPPHIAGSLADIGRALKDSFKGVKPVKQNGVHLTLSFLGDQTEERVAFLKELMLDERLSHEKFQIQLSSIGTFPGSGNPRVIWAGIGNGADLLVTYQNTVKSLLIKKGFQEADEKRRFFPHLTIARNKFSIIPHNILSRFTLNTDPFAIDKCILFQSTLHPSGAEYTKLAQNVFCS